MGAGPSRLAAGAVQRLRAQGHLVEERRVELTGWQAELQSAFDLHREVASLTAARGKGQLPVLLAGNCNTSLGILAGAAEPGCRQGLIWLDAHGDFNTPETDTTGFLDGQGLAMAVGRCWQAALAEVPGFEPIPEHRVLLLGARDLDSAEEGALAASDISVLAPAAARKPAQVGRALTRLASQVDTVHVHIDVDVHDPSSGTANGYSAPDGLSDIKVRRILEQTATRIPIRSASLASYDPAYDTSGRMHEVALELLELIAAIATTTHHD